MNNYFMTNGIATTINASPNTVSYNAANLLTGK